LQKIRTTLSKTSIRNMDGTDLKGFMQLNQSGWWYKWTLRL